MSDDNKEQKELIFPILSDAVNNTDESPDQVHESIAKKISNIINSPNDQGYSIGLEGKWGSGKSTVLNLINKKLTAENTETEKKNFIFYIDAWAHEGDLLRRVVLEKLIKHVNEEIPESITDLNDLSNTISNHLITRTITNTPVINKFGTFLSIFSLLFLPIGISFIDNSCNDLTLKIGYPPNILFLVGVGFCLIPLLVALVGKFIFKKNILWSVETYDNTTTETSKESERTSIEFEKFFETIIKYIQKKGYKNFIYEIDNLDRIQGQDALKIWSTLQIFTQNKNLQIHDTNDFSILLWNIVPYDSIGLGSLWKEKDSFLDKSFQLRIEIPQLPFSGWESVIEKLISEKVQNITEEKKDIIVSVLKLSRDNISDAPSFREIKLYINQIGMLYNLYGNYIGLFSICYYTILRYLKHNSADDIKSKLLDNTLEKDNTLNFCSDKKQITKEIASLLYGVSLDKGMELLLSGPIENALFSGNTEFINKTEKQYKKTFYSITENILKNDTGKNCISYISTLANTIYPNLKLQILSYMKRNITFITNNIAQTNNEDLCSIIIVANDSDQLLQKISKAYVDNIIKELTDPNSSNLILDNFKKILSCAKRKDLLTISYQRLKIQGFMKLVQLVKDSEDYTIIGKQIINYEDIDKDISKTIIPTKAIEDTTISVIKLACAVGNENWSNSLLAMKENINQFRGQRNLNLNTNNMTILELVMKNKPSEDSISTIKSILNLWQFWNYVYYYRENRNILVIASLAAAIYNDGNYYSNIQQVEYALNGNKEALSLYNTSDQNEVVDYYYNFIIETQNYMFIWDLAKIRHAKVVGKILNKAIKENNDNLFNITKVYGAFIKTYDLVSEENQQLLLDKLLITGIFIDEINETIFLENENACWLVLNNKQNKKFIPKIKSEIANIDTTRWLSSISNVNSLLPDICIKCADNKVLIELKNYFADAYSQFIIQKIDTDNSDLNNSDKFKVLYGIVSGSFQEHISKKISKHLLENKFKCNQKIVNFLTEIIDFSYLLTERESDFIDILLDFIKSRNKSVLKNICLFIGNTKTKRKLKESSKELLQQPLEDCIKGDDEELIKICQNIKDIFIL